MYRGGLDRFKKAQSAEPFGITLNSAAQNHAQKLSSLATVQQNAPAMAAEAAASPAAAITQVGGGQSTWQPPDWAVEPRPGVHYLEVLKDGQVLGKIGLDKRRHIFGRQFPTCDFVLDHQSVSRQHAAVVPHKNGSIFVIDLGSAHGTFVANERLTKDSPVELEVGQSLRFAASTRIYILRKNMAALFPAPSLPPEIILLSPPDPSNEEAVLAYNTTLNRYGISISDLSSNLGGMSTVSAGDVGPSERPPKKLRKARVAFRDQVGGDLVQVVGISDGADVDTEPGPIGVKEGSLVGKYESLVQITVIPKGKELNAPKEDGVSPKGVTDKLQQVLNKVKSAPKTGIYDDLYGDSVPMKVGSSWAYKSAAVGDEEAGGTGAASEARSHNALSARNAKESSAYDSDDLFGDDD